MPESCKQVSLNKSNGLISISIVPLSLWMGHRPSDILDVKHVSRTFRHCNNPALPFLASPSVQCSNTGLEMRNKVCWVVAIQCLKILLTILSVDLRQNPIFYPFHYSLTSSSRSVCPGPFIADDDDDVLSWWLCPSFPPEAFVRPFPISLSLFDLSLSPSFTDGHFSSSTSRCV